MKSIFFSCLAVCTLTASASAADDRRELQAIAPTSASVVSLALARADVAVASSVITPNTLKGEFAEGLTSKFILSGRGKWQALSPRLGPQGLDHIAFRMNRDGHPTGLLVGETKYGSSQLGETKSGVQMGPKYTAVRLAALSSRLKDIKAQVEKGIIAQSKPSSLGSRFEVEVPISDETSVSFWRDRQVDKQWKYDGPQKLLPKAKAQLALLSDYLNGAAEGKISYAKRIFVWKLREDRLLLTVLNADKLAEGMSLASLPARELPPIRLSDTKWPQDAFKKAYSSEILKKLPGMSKQEALSLADEVYATCSTAKGAEGLLARRSFAGFAGGHSLKVGAYGAAISVPLELAFQTLGSGQVDWGRVGGVAALSGGSALMGTLAGDFTTYGLMRSQFGVSMTARAAGSLGLFSSSQAARFAGVTVGGGVASVVFGYGGYFMGYSDLKTANRSAFAGTVGTASGMVASAATLSVVAAYGTAGTGVAISTLGGAAAANASLAVLGGGTLASGGFGAAGGAVVLSTGVGIVVVGVSAAVMYGFHLYDEAQDNERIRLTLKEWNADAPKQSFVKPTWGKRDK